MSLSTSTDLPKCQKDPFPLVQELVDIVIDFLHDDTKALRNCSLVCRSWVARTRLHLISEGGGSKRKINRWTSAEFLEILESPYLTVGPYVRDLVLDGHRCSHENKVSLDKSTCPCSQADHRNNGIDRDGWIEKLAVHLPKLANVTSLGLEHLNWIHFGGDVLRTLASSFPSLRKLVVLGCTVPSVTELIEVFCAFPAAEDVDVHENITLCSENEWKKEYNRIRPFKALHLDVNCPRQSRHNLLQVLLAQDPVPTTNFLHLYTIPYNKGEDTGSLNSVVDYIRACGSSLETLKLRFPFPPSLDVAGPSLQCNTSNFCILIIVSDL
jgi:hypothetical protein